MPNFNNALFSGHASRDSGPEQNKVLNEQKKRDYYRQQQIADQNSPMRQQAYGPNGLPQRNTGMSAEYGGRHQTHSYESAPVQNRPPHAFDRSNAQEPPGSGEDDRRYDLDMRPQPLATSRRPIDNSRRDSAGAGNQVSSYHRLATQARPPPPPAKEREVSDVGGEHEARWQTNYVEEPQPHHFTNNHSPTSDNALMHGALANRTPTVGYVAPRPDRLEVDTLAGAPQNDDPRPAKDSTPSRFAVLSPRNLVSKPGKMFDKYKQHRREKSEAKDDNPETTSFRVLSQNLDNTSTRGIVNGDLTPQPSRHDLQTVKENKTHGGLVGTSQRIVNSQPSAHPNSEESGFDDLAATTQDFNHEFKRIQTQPVTSTPSSAEPGTRYGGLDGLPIAQSMQSQPSQAPETFQRNVDRPTNFYDASGDDEEYETDGNVNGQNVARVNAHPMSARAEHDLFMVHSKLRDAAPKHAQLAGSSTAEQAAQLVVNLFHRADHGWKSQFERAENLQRMVADSERLQQELGHLQRQNKDLVARSELFSVKEELFARTKKDCERLETEATAAKREKQADLEAQRRSYENKLEELRQDNSDLRHGRIELERAVDLSRNEAAHNAQEVDRLNDVVKTTLARVESEKRQNGQDRERLTAEHRESLANMENMHVQDTRDLREQVARLEAEDASRNLEHEGQIESLRRDHDQAIRNLQADHRINLDRKDDEIRDAERHLDEHYEGELRKKDQHIQRLKTTHEDQMADQGRRHNEENRGLREEISRLRADLHEIEARVRNEYDVRERRSNAAHQEKLREAQQRSENLMGALVQRDGFKGIADRVVEARFKKLAKSVDQLSRTCTNWERSKEADWPCTERSLQGQENVRQVKQYFVQNAIWTILYDQIFDTPFKSFGFDGDSYFREWTKEFGEETSSLVSPHWPQPGSKCEKWRYDTMQKCIDAVEKPSGDPTLKRAYADGMQRVCDELTRDLDRMVSSTSGLQRNLKDIVNQATKLWLDLGVQRCRILIVVPLASRGTSSRRDSQRLRDLVIQPEVQRVGNAQGENLETQEVVVCKMDVHRLVIR